MAMAADTAQKVMTEAHNRIVSFHNGREQAAAARRPKNFVLYHYTTADGLKGIVENDELWATSAYYLNDSTEIMYGYQLIDEALGVWRTKVNSPEDSMAGGLVYSLERQFGHDYLERNIITIITPIYLTCFCEEDDLLSQWRAYSLRSCTSQETVFGRRCRVCRSLRRLVHEPWRQPSIR